MGARMTTDHPLPTEGEARPDPPSFGRALPRGLGLNLLVRDVEAALTFQVRVLGAEVRYWDRDFAVVAAQGSTWLVHSDRAYRDHPLVGIATGAGGRGAGAELRLYGRDPDAAEAETDAAGGIVLAGAADKPHGVREAFLIDPDGYVWVPTVPSPEEEKHG